MSGTTSENRSLESQGIRSNDTSSKFLGVSLIFHALLVLLVVYLNYPAIKQKFNPEPESVAVEVKEPAEVTTPAPVEAKTSEVAAPEAAEEKVVEKPVVQKQPTQAIQPKKDNALQQARMKISEFKDEELTSTSIRALAKAVAAKPQTVTKTKVVTEVKAKSSKKSASSSLPQKKSAAVADENESEVLVPKATITEISEVPVNEDGIPLPQIADEVADSGLVTESMTTTTTTGDALNSGGSSAGTSSNLQQMARTELFEETVEENSSITEVRQSNPSTGLSRPAPTRNQIRAVTALRQRQGNPLPRYSDFERLRRHEGQVTYLAYVTEEGRLTDFILEESSGHANLDQKTLSALKGWRFVQGQEGWVEIPQVWILTGEAEQLPTQLRR